MIVCELLPAYCLVRAAFSLLKLDAAQTSHVLPPVWQCVGTVAVAKKYAFNVEIM